MDTFLNPILLMFIISFKFDMLIGIEWYVDEFEISKKEEAKILI